MTFKILLSRSVQTPNSDKNWQTSYPLQTFVCNVIRHLEFITEQGQLGLRVSGFPGHWVAGSQNVTQFHVCCVGIERCTNTAADVHSCPVLFLRRSAAGRDVFNLSLHRNDAQNTFEITSKI